MTTIHISNASNTTSANTTTDLTANMMLNNILNASYSDSEDNEASKCSSEPGSDVDLTELYLDPEWCLLADFLGHYPSIDEGRLEEYWSRHRWEHLGALHGRFESSYLPSTKRYQQGQKVDYDRCTAQELKRFINDRRLQDPYSGGITLKWYYIRVLVEADQQGSSFRFMDLPPELRVRIYDSLLTLHNTGSVQREKYCHPQILATCQLVHSEAYTVLYDGNALECVLTSGGQYCNDYSESFVVNGRLIPAYDSGDIANISEYIVRFSHISIVVRFLACGFCNVEPEPMPLNLMLAGLACVLMDRHRLANLEITLEVRKDVERHEVYKEVLYPLRRLRNVRKLVIKSNDENFPPHFKKILTRDMAKTTPVLNTLKYWNALRDEGKAWQQLLHAAHGIPYTWTWTDDSVWKFLMPAEFKTLFRQLEEELVAACLSGPGEHNFLVKLFRLRKLFDDRQHKSLDQASKLWGDKVAARQAFQSDPVTGALTKKAPTERQRKWAETSTLDDDFVGWEEGVCS